MEELIKLVSKKTGLSDEMAEKGVGMVAGFLQGQLPSAASGQIGEVLGTKPSTAAKEAKSTGDLVKLISKQTGVSGDMAEKVLEVVLGYLKKNLPEPLGGVVDMLVSGAGTAGGGAGMEDLLGGILGK
jgi:nucleoid DNA-binding protein